MPRFSLPMHAKLPTRTIMLPNLTSWRPIVKQNLLQSYAKERKRPALLLLVRILDPKLFSCYIGHFPSKFGPSRINQNRGFNTFVWVLVERLYVVTQCFVAMKTLAQCGTRTRIPCSPGRMLRLTSPALFDRPLAGLENIADVTSDQTASVMWGVGSLRPENRTCGFESSPAQEFWWQQNNQ